MSAHDEEKKRQRSMDLCQLIYDRQIDSEIGFEIRKLLEEGVLIDYRDQNRNQKTAIHLAVEKCDGICVEFLLRFKPNLEVADGDGKTTLELAESKGYQNILNALQNSIFDVVNESYIEVIDFESLTRQKIEAIKSRPTFKVLKLTNCPSVKDVWMKLGDHDYAITFSKTSHLFFIAIETKETNMQNDYELMKKVFNLRRPMIVQLTSSNSRKSKIYFKDDSKDFVEISDTEQITQEEFDDVVQSGVGCNMKLLVAPLKSNLFGHFTGDLLSTKLNANENRNEAVNQFAKSNALCHRFFKLFGESQPQIDTIIAALLFEGDQSLLAILDFPFELKDEKLKLNEYQQDILRVVDSCGSNLLMMAIEQGNLDAVKLLLRCDCDFNHLDAYEERASDICWEMNDFDCLAELIEAGSPYPNDFCVEVLEESPEAVKINLMIEAINSFHANIEQGEIEEVKKFITSQPHIKHAYDTSNKCALTVALQSNQVDIYSLLMSKGFEPGADDEYYTVLDKSKFKKEITKSHRKYFRKAFDEPHLKRLFNKFKLSFGSKDRAKCSTIIREMFDELNEIDELIPILQICSLSDKLQIVFDFNCNSIVDMDPTSPSNALGAVYPIDGFVYVGAKNHEKEFFKVIGTLIHELTHYAMKLTHENSCKPYDGDDTDNENRFEEITTETKKICEGNPSTDSIVTTVFRCYKQIVWHAELIVRVPQLLAHHKMNPKALEAAERNIPELFHFYREKALKDVERESKVLHQEYLIGKINKQTGITRKMENLKVNFEKVGVIDLKSPVTLITSNAPQLTLAMLNQIDCDGSHIFVSLEQVAIGNILEKIVEVNAKESSTSLIVDCIGQAQKYQKSLGKLMKDIKNIKTIALIMTADESSKAKENFPEIEFKTLTHKWAELTESSKVHLLDQNVIFQGVEMKLNELVEPSSEAMNFFPLGKLVDCKKIKIGHELHQTLHKFFIPRKFIKKGQESSARVTANAKSFEELLRSESRMGTMIISDEAGSGKSVALFEIAKSLHVLCPHRWVLFVGLNRHIEAFKSVGNHEKIETLEDFIVQNILKNEPEFNRELFLQMFQAGKTFVLFDGFDEISPNFKDLILHVLKSFQPESGNRLFVTTRPHLEADLKGTLGEFVFEIEKFSAESQKSFLREYWQSVGLEMSQEDFEDLSNRLLHKFYEILYACSIGLPLLMRMTAEIFDDQIKENLLRKVDSLNVASVFDHFVDKYFLRWREKGSENEIPRKEGSKIERDGGVLEVHHKIALNHIFQDEFLSFDESDAEKISRVGLIRYDKTEKTFQFIHETFAEYFVADFIWFHLNKKNRDPSHECNKAVEILIKVCLSYDVKTAGVIRNFLDHTLAPMKFNPSEAFCKFVAKFLSKVLKGRNRFDILNKSLVVWQQNLSSFLLSIGKHVEKDVLLKMLRSKGHIGDDTALLYATLYDSCTTVSTLCDIITNCIDKPKEIYQEECHFMGKNVLSRAASNKNGGILTTLCENLNSVLTEDEIKIMFQREDEYGHNIVARAADNNNVEVFREAISLLLKYFSRDEIKILLRAVDGKRENFFHHAIIRHTNERLKLKFEVVKSNFSFEEQKIFFYKPSTGPNMFHCAAQNRNVEIFQTIIEATRDVLSGDEIKSMLMQKVYQGSNVIHIIAYYGNEVTLKAVNLVLRERLSDDEIRSLLLKVNSKGQNCFRMAANNSELGFQVFCETIGNLLSVEDQNRLLQQSVREVDIVRLACGSYYMNEIVPSEIIKKLLTAKDDFGWNVFDKLARRGDVDIWNKLISFTQSRFSSDEMKYFLLSCDRNGANCLYSVGSMLSCENMIEAICETIKTVLSVDDQKKFVRQKDYDHRNVFHKAAIEQRPFKCFSLYDGLSKILSKDEIKEMLMEKNSIENSNILCYNRKYPTTNLLSCDLIPFLRGILKDDEIKNLFFDVDQKGRNFFHCAVQFSSRFEIKSISKSIKKVLIHDEPKKFFGIKIPNVFHLALRNFRSGIFATTHECLKDVLTENEIESLIQKKDSENKNILHLICEHDVNKNGIGLLHYDASYVDGERRLTDFLKVLRDVCDSGKLKKFLTSSDKYGSNCLLLAAQFKDQPFVRELICFIQDELDLKEQRDLFQKVDKDLNNIFTCASLNNVPEMFSFVENLLKEILLKSQIETLMKHHLKMKRKISLNVSR